MSGTSEGNKKAAKTTKERYGEDWHAKHWKALGSKKNPNKGFASMDKDRHKKVSAEGGRKSKPPFKLIKLKIERGEIDDWIDAL